MNAVAGLRGIQDDMREMKASLQRSEDKSAESRAGVHRRLDEAVDRIARVESSVASVNEDVAEMKPITDDVRRWRLIGIGALSMIGIGGVALGVSFADALKRIGGLLIGRI
ncbi:hypothetical protein D3C80_1715440 [compost metagenome]